MIKTDNTITERELIESLLEKVSNMESVMNSYEMIIFEIHEAIISTPSWIPLRTVADKKGLSSEALRKRIVESGDFEPNKDFKYDRNKIMIHISVASQIERLRKPKSITKVA